MVMAWGGLAARQGNQVRFPPLIQFGRMSWPDHIPFSLPRQHS